MSPAWLCTCTTHQKVLTWLGLSAEQKFADELVGALAKEGVDEVKVLREYVETLAKGRSGPWKTSRR